MPFHTSHTLSGLCNIGSRRSYRVPKLPNYLANYVHSLLKPPLTSPDSHDLALLSLNASCSLHNHISSDNLFPNSQSFIINITHISEPSSYKKVVVSPAHKSLLPFMITISRALYLYYQERRPLVVNGCTN